MIHRIQKLGFAVVFIWIELIWLCYLAGGFYALKSSSSAKYTSILLKVILGYCDSFFLQLSYLFTVQKFARIRRFQNIIPYFLLELSLIFSPKVMIEIGLFVKRKPSKSATVLRHSFPTNILDWIVWRRRFTCPSKFSSSFLQQLPRAYFSPRFDK